MVGKRDADIGIAARLQRVWSDEQLGERGKLFDPRRAQRIPTQSVDRDHEHMLRCSGARGGWALRERRRVGALIARADRERAERTE